tara:strand:+ start:6701 stop:7075 length:375 start_codon:yes stop_codon:yes gene_type:complete
MPIYVYEHPETQESIEIIQGMNDAHEYIDDEGVEWRRVFHVPQMSMDTQVDPYSESDYLKATANKGGTIGDMMDYSKELSQKRAEKDGTDPIQEKHFKDYEKKNKRKHPSKAKVYESKNVRVEY